MNEGADAIAPSRGKQEAALAVRSTDWLGIPDFLFLGCMETNKPPLPIAYHLSQWSRNKCVVSRHVPVNIGRDPRV